MFLLRCPKCLPNREKFCSARKKTLEGTLPVNSKIKLFPWYLCIENVFDWHLWSFILFGLVKLISGYQNLKSTCPKALWYRYRYPTLAIVSVWLRGTKCIGFFWPINVVKMWWRNHVCYGASEYPNETMRYHSDRISGSKVIKHLRTIVIFSRGRLSRSLRVKKVFFFFFLGLVKLIFGLPKSEEYLPEGLPGI